MLQLHGEWSWAKFEGRIDHIDSGLGRRFRSLEELLEFIEQVLEATRKSETGDEEAEAKSMPPSVMS